MALAEEQKRQDVRLVVLHLVTENIRHAEQQTT